MAYFCLIQAMLILSFYLSLVVAFRPDSTLYFSAGNRTTWTNSNQSFPQETKFTDGSLARFILFKAEPTQNSTFGNYGFGFRFFSNCPYKDYCDLSIMFADMLNGEVNVKERPRWFGLKIGTRRLKKMLHSNSPKVESCLWWMNMARKFGQPIHLVRLLLVWALMNTVLWCSSITLSSQYPTDTLLLGQELWANQQITSRTTSVHDSQSLFYLSLNPHGMAAFVVGDEPTQYLTIDPPGADEPLSTIPKATEDPSPEFVQFTMGGIGFYYQSKDKMVKLQLDVVNSSVVCTTIHFLRLDADGGLRIYGWNPGDQCGSLYYWPNKLDECWIPLRCGRLGACKWGTCGCPIGPDGKDHFALINYQYPNLGCREINPPIPFQGVSIH